MQLQDDFLSELSGNWKIMPRAMALNLPSTGASVVRWTVPYVGHGECKPVKFSKYHLISLILRPMRAAISLDDRQIFDGSIRSRTVRVVSAGHTAGWHSDTPFDLLHFYLPKTLDDDSQADSHVQRLSDSFYRNDDTISRIGDLLIHELSDGAGSYSAAMVDGLCKALVAHAYRRYHAPSQEAEPSGGLAPHALRKVMEFIARNLDRPVVLDEMAQVAGISKYHFARQFAASVGAPPYRFVFQERMKKACRLLSTTDVSVSAVGRACGFDDPSHFSRAFRTFSAVTPRDYRNRHLETH